MSPRAANGGITDMTTHARPLMATVLALVLLLGTAPRARAATSPSEGEAQAIGRTPPRLSYINGEVSFLRPGAQDWSPAQANTPLAPGDELYTSTQGDLEMQVGTRAFVRAWGDTQLGLANQEPDFLQFRVTNGHVSLDLRSLDPGRTVELDTPHAAFTIDHPGFYRADVTQERTSFITRRAGQATMTSAGGQAVVPRVIDRLLGVGAGTCGGSACVRAGSRGVLRRPRDPSDRRRPGGQLGSARLGRACGALAGTSRFHRETVVGRLVRPARCAQRRHQPNHGR